ncbi:hypothetical protein D3C81_1163810 [compost metagenome]
MVERFLDEIDVFRGKGDVIHGADHFRARRLVALGLLLQLGTTLLGIVNRLQGLGLEQRRFLLRVACGLVTGFLDQGRGFLPGLHRQVLGLFQRLGGLGGQLRLGIVGLFLQVIPKAHALRAPFVDDELPMPLIGPGGV